MTAIDQNGDYKIDYGEFAKVFRRASESRWLAKQVETAPGTDVAVEGASGVPGAVTRHVTRGALRGLTGGVARGASAAVHLSVHPRGGGLVAEVTTSME